ncbi:hypothetical protein BDW22DRAFT_1343339 [Trametopsis cervina]|nr:hypothetical protein BDW22DRAFT_1343339 [Trametopsis cervina]
MAYPAKYAQEHMQRRCTRDGLFERKQLDACYGGSVTPTIVGPRLKRSDWRDHEHSRPSSNIPALWSQGTSGVCTVANQSTRYLWGLFAYELCCGMNGVLIATALIGGFWLTLIYFLGGSKTVLASSTRRRLRYSLLLSLPTLIRLVSRRYSASATMHEPCKYENAPTESRFCAYDAKHHTA